MQIPDYYRQFQPGSPTETKHAEEEKTPQELNRAPDKPDSQFQEQVKPQVKQVPSRTPQDKTKPFLGNGFTINQIEDWQDKTIYTLTGPVTGGIQHNVIINIDREVPFDNLNDYAEWQIRTLEQELKGCVLLKKGETKLNDGSPAYEAVFKWYPVNGLRIYQHQIYTMFKTTAYKLTASFTKKTIKTLGPQVERMMLSFKLLDDAK